MTSSRWRTIHPSWHPILEPVAGQLEEVLAQLDARRAAGEHIEPQPEHVLRVFQMPFSEVKVLLIGQDPYPTPGHAVGLSFSMPTTVRPLARSLQNIYRELFDDVGIEPATSGDLSSWEQQGVFLLNTVLTVTAGTAGSHHKLGWQDITACAIRALAERGTPLVVILWGREAQKVAPYFDGPQVLVLEAAHPSPLSARRGFFGSRPFSRTNEFLTAHNITPIDWRVASNDASQSELF